MPPWGGSAYHEITVQILTRAPEDLSKSMRDALFHTSLDSVENIALDSRLALDYFLAEQGKFCIVINKTCLPASNSGQVNIKETHEKAQRLQRYTTKGPNPSSICNMVKKNLSSLSWFLPFLGTLTAIILLFIFRPCFHNCLVNFISKELEFLKLQMILTQGYKN